MRYSAYRRYQPQRAASPRSESTISQLSFREASHSQKLVPPPAHQLVRFVPAEILELAHEHVVQRQRRAFVVGVRAPRRFGDDLVDHAQLEQLGRGDLERRRRLLAHLLALAVLPENRRAPFRSEE